MKVQESIIIRAEAAKIWPFLIEPVHIKKWCLPVIKIDRTSEQKSGPGTTFYFEERAAWQLLKMNFVVSEWIEHRSLAFKLTSGNFVKSYEQRYTLENTNTGLKVNCYEDVTLPLGILGKFAGIFRGPVTRAHLKRNLAAIKIMAETV